MNGENEPVYSPDLCIVTVGLQDYQRNFMCGQVTNQPPFGSEARESPT